MHPHSSIIRLPGRVHRRLEAAAGALLKPQTGRAFDFTRPLGEEAILPPDSVSWRVFKNPVALWVGGVAAVILELAEPAVRTGVWEHSSFRADPMDRLQRTGLAAMVTVYGARSVAEPMIAGVVRMHAKVEGVTPAGVPYSAGDTQLLTWVHATAAFGFAEAYSRYVAPLSPAELDAFYREGAPVSQLYGALDSPGSDAERRALFDSMQGRLEASAVIFQFLQIMRETAVFPPPLHRIQGMLVRAAVEMLPQCMRACLGFTDSHGLRRWERWIVKRAGAVSDRIVLSESPAVQSCLRLGLPATYLYS